MENLKDGLLEITVQKAENQIQITWKGKSNSKNPSEVLDPYFDKLLEKLEGTEIMIDFSTMEHMNSSTLHSIIKLLKGLNERALKTVVTYDKNTKWQCASFKSLETFSSILTHINIKGK